MLHTWLYNNTGKSVFGAIVFHAMTNLSWQLFPNSGSHYDPRITALIVTFISVLGAGRNEVVTSSGLAAQR